jgi:hypothetical protein
MIQVNQQNTSINVGDTDKVSLNRESRERVKNAVLGLLSSLAQPIAVETTFTPVESEDTTDDI